MNWAEFWASFAAQLVVAVYVYGRLTEKVASHEKRLNKAEGKLENHETRISRIEGQNI